MKFKIIIVVSIFLLSVNHSKIMAQIPGEYFNSCLTSAPLSCGNNTISLPILPGYPAIATNSGDHIVRYYLNVTTPITTSIFFTGVNMQPYSIIISTPLSGSLNEYCQPNPGVPPSILYNYSVPTSTGAPYTTPVTTFLPGLYVFYVRYYYTGPSTMQPFYTFNVNLNCLNTSTICPTAVGANYQTNNCPQSVEACQGKCKSIEGTLFINNGTSVPNYSVTFNFGDGTANQTYAGNTNGVSFIHPYSNGTYTVTATINGPGTCVSTYTFVANIICTPPPCADCIGSFAPIPDSTYIISAWVKEANATINTTTYTNAKINISFHTAVTTQPGSTPVGTPVLISPTGLIIDGWQKIEEKFKIPAGAAALKLDLISNGQDANFDDIRVFPFNGSMKSYVYDPKTMRLMAELDERNYATFYEYDEEGKLIRVKKETEKGVMTIKESRNSTPIK
jgi:hypothetical protein